MKNSLLPFAEVVRARMKEKGLGLREFCRAVDLDPSFFSKVLAGKRSPPSDESDLRRIAGVLELDAPGLIVAAGRIPAEWRRLWEDHALLQKVHRLLAGSAVAAGSESAGSQATGDIAFPATQRGEGRAKERVRSGNWDKTISSDATRGSSLRKDMGEELL